MEISKFIKNLKQLDSGEFFTGVPDSLLSTLNDYIIQQHGVTGNHIIAANEGNAVGIAAGYYMSTGKIPVVYLQNSGIGNIVNPVASLLNENVYGIPCIFVIGWRGEPGVHDEPQHVFQGKITLDILDVLGIIYFVIDKNTSEDEINDFIKKNKVTLNSGRNLAFVVKKNGLSSNEKSSYQNENSLIRENVIKEITAVSQDDIVISTTGKSSRELFEVREFKNQSHKFDFLTVGSMGHSSSIAFEIAVNKPKSKIWCIDGDGAAIMHLGSMAIIGSNKPKNLIHVLINNASHESVGGFPTAAKTIDFLKIAEGCGYTKIFSVDTYESLVNALSIVKNINELCFVEIKTTIGSRSNLGRPTKTAKENKEIFMDLLNSRK